MNQLLRGISKPGENQVLKSKNPRRSKAKPVKRPSECRDLFANLSEYLDGRVEPLTCDQMRGHIEACPSCVAFIRDLKTAIDRCRSLQISCDSAFAPRLRAILTREYLRVGVS